ncbi:unnamed protein product [Darwinula stevensoni]|uniref:Peptidase S1 domain-containing protein n=1 Tax=Darwinula stevensoni TaxID=69355 RepID=A0A7R8XHZ4_9CRUS|nr:unnamed protein product [Darwinula stevensoni]CAG0893330.1 unnamed protein product [Darwinula stevensoni]
MKKLEELWYEGGTLGPTLSSGLLEFQSNALKLVDLRNNGISRLAPGAIAGLRPDTTVHLNENKITVLSEGSFRPMLDILSMGDGVLDLSGNPILCDCEMSWLVLGRKFLKYVSGKCHNGTEFKDLDSGFFHACPRECPYHCINSLWLSLCTPGTVILSHVDDCRSGELCCQPHLPKTTTMTSSSIPDVFVCGRKNYQVTLSKGGKPSQIGEWPWETAIYDVHAQDIVCGGALIREEWVLTAAHCVTIHGTDRPRKQEDLLVYLGKHHRAHVKDDEYVQIRQVSHIFHHKDYSIQNYDSDIALLKLTKPSVLTERVQLICLPTKFDVSDENLQDGMQGWVAGWGYNGSNLLTAVLTEVQLPVISNRLCRRDTTHFTGDFSATRTLTSNMFCAGHSRNTSIEDYRTVCPGDSGSPMVFLSIASQDSYWTVEGIVSHFFQKETCSLRRPGQYGVFTRVNRFTRWIDEVLEGF